MLLVYGNYWNPALDLPELSFFLSDKSSDYLFVAEGDSLDRYYSIEDFFFTASIALLLALLSRF